MATTSRASRRRLRGDLECSDRIALSLQREAALRSLRIGRGDRGIGRSIDEDLSRRGHSGEPGGGIRDIADRGEVLEASAADIPDVLLAARDADADLKRILDGIGVVDRFE